MSRGIRAEHLRCAYGAFVAIKDLSFEVPAGSFVSLLGPSGCGKSTTLRCLAGLERPISGDIWFGKVQVVGLGIFVPPRRRDAAMVFQSYALWPHMRVFDNVAYALRTRGVPSGEIARRVADVADMLGIGELVLRYPNELSGGQQQRVALARSLIYEPSILFLDEPLSNLDAKLRTQMRAELGAIQRRVGTTAVYVTHDQKEALAMSDLVLLMRNGDAIQYGTPHELYHHPADRYAAEFLGPANFIEGIIAEVRDGPFATIVSSQGLAVTTSQPLAGPDVAGARVTAMVRPRDVHIEGANDDGHNQLTARVRAAAFVGEHYEVLLEVGGVPLQALSDVPLKVGEEVPLSIAPESVTIVERQ